MKISDKHQWRLVISGVDSSELSSAFRDSRFADEWVNHANQMDDTDYYAGISTSIEIPDMETLIVALKCVGNLRPSHGINLCCDADFGTFKTNCTLSMSGTGYAETSATVHRTGKSLDLEAIEKLSDAEKALGELRNLLAVKGGA